MARTKKVQCWVTNKEYEKLRQYAEKKELSMSEVLRDYIKCLDTED